MRPSGGFPAGLRHNLRHNSWEPGRARKQRLRSNGMVGTISLTAESKRAFRLVIRVGERGSDMLVEGDDPPIVHKFLLDALCVLYLRRTPSSASRTQSEANSKSSPGATY